MTAPLNISSDDAAFFQASMTGQQNDTSDVEDDGEDTEDPVGRGASKIGQLDMFVARPPRTRHLARGGSGQPIPQVNLTPGARLVPF